jgi:uncharacterized phage infection (PIP) family protein YhgE
MPTDDIKAKAGATKRQAKATKNQASQTVRTAEHQGAEGADTVKGQAEQTIRAAEKTAERAGRTVSATLTDTAYAYVGLTDSAVAWLRQLPRYVGEIRAEGPDTLRERLERSFDSFSVRGRQVVDAITTSPATQRALEQSKAAREQLRTARGQFRRAGQEVAEAAGDAAEAATAAPREVGRHTDVPDQVRVEISTESGDKVEASAK